MPAAVKRDDGNVVAGGGGGGKVGGAKLVRGYPPLASNAAAGLVVARTEPF